MRSDLKTRTVVNSTTRSPPAKALETFKDLPSSCYETHKGTWFKENENINQYETPKLGVDPMQMKRKKKGGGYNMRKSLTWDRAFFTEEGVLDPVELSIMIGTSAPEGLSVIGEESSGDLELACIGLQESENNRLKEFPGEDVVKGRRQICLPTQVGSSSSKSITSPSLISSHKVTTNAGSKSGSRCGDRSQVLASTPLKRPANSYAGRASAKETKLPKVPNTKPGLSSICATTESSILKLNCAKHNQIAEPALQIQRNSAVKSSSKNLRSSQNAPKASSLKLAQCIGKNPGPPTGKQLSSVKKGSLHIDRADTSGLNGISSDTALSSPMHLSESQDNSTSSAAPCAQIPHVRGTSVNPSQSQTMKPSGLRMPSPSLSFFSQPKASVLSLRDRNAEVYGYRRPGYLSLKDMSRRTAESNSDVPENTICSKGTDTGSQILATSHVNDVSCKIVKSDREGSSMLKVGMEILPDARHYELISNKLIKDRSYVADRQVHDLSKRSGTQMEFQVDTHLEKLYHETQTQSGSCEQMMDYKNYKKPIHGGPLRTESRLSGSRNLELLSEHHNVSDRLVTENSVKTLPGSEQCRSSLTESAYVEASENEEVSINRSYSGSMHPPLNMSHKLLEQNACKQDAVRASTAGGCNTNPNVTSVASDGNKQSGESLEIHDLFLKVEPVSQKDVGQDTSDRLLPEKPTCIQAMTQEKNVETLPFVAPNRNGRSESKMESTEALVEMHESESGENQMIGQSPVNREFSSTENSVSSESHNGLNKMDDNQEDRHTTNANTDVSSSVTMESVVDQRWKNNNEVENHFRNELANKSMLDRVFQDCISPEIIFCSSSPKEACQLSLGQGTDAEPRIGDCGNVEDSGPVLVQTQDLLIDCCIKRSECMELSSAGLLAKSLSICNEGLHVEDHLQDKNSACDGSINDDADKSVVYSVGCGTDDPSHIADAIKDPSGSEHFSGLTEDPQRSSSELHFSMDYVKVKASVSPNRKKGKTCQGKCHMFHNPQELIPFSEEWLAAIEAAGEDILTRKSGAVQNSPPDKSLPEPSPWSPVKRKNNQLGPFDCTKFTNVPTSHSN